MVFINETKAFMRKVFKWNESLFMCVDIDCEGKSCVARHRVASASYLHLRMCLRNFLVK